MKVLVVEDDTAVQLSVARILATRGHEVVTAENGLEAFARLGDAPYGAIVCDLALPFMQGTRFFEQIRKTYPRLAARVVFVTGFASDGTTEKFLRESGQPYLAKPFEATDLLNAVDRVSRRPEDPSAAAP